MYGALYKSAKLGVGALLSVSAFNHERTCNVESKSSTDGTEWHHTTVTSAAHGAHQISYVHLRKDAL